MRFSFMCLCATISGGLFVYRPDFYLLHFLFLSKKLLAAGAKIIFNLSIISSSCTFYCNFSMLHFIKFSNESGSLWEQIVFMWYLTAYFFFGFSAIIFKWNKSFEWFIGFLKSIYISQLGYLFSWFSVIIFK